MFDDIDRAFFQLRAKEERASAQRADNPRVAALHSELASRYERKAAALEREPAISRAA